MIELLLAAAITLLPDYLFRRYAQGKRIGHEITIYSVWYELRFGIVGCAILTVLLVTVIFYFHPPMSNVLSAFRTLTIISDRAGRVDKVFVENNQRVAAGDPIFSLETGREAAAAETARRRIAEIDAASVEAEAELAVARGNIFAAEASLTTAQDDYQRREQLFRRNRDVVSEQELSRLAGAVEERAGALSAAQAREEAIKARLTISLPAQRQRAEAEVAQAELEISKSTVVAGVNGIVQQFVLRPGDIVSPILRPAGILVPEGSGRGRFVASFPQIATQLLHAGLVTEITCPSLPLAVIAMRVSAVQETIATGQIRPTDLMVDLQQRAAPGTVFVYLEPLFDDDRVARIPPGSSCLGVAYSDHSRRIASGEITGLRATLLSIVDMMGFAGAIVIRAQAILLPIRTIVFPN
jgi:multidrug resistance efflux pump